MKPLSCDQARPLMSDYLGGAALPKEVEALEAHLEGCPKCREESAAFLWQHRALAEMAGESLAPRMLSKLGAAMAGVASAPGRRAKRRGWIPLLSLAAAGLIGVGVWFILSNRSGVPEVASLEETQGTVFVTSAEGRTPATALRTLLAANGIETRGSGSRAVVHFADGTQVEVRADTIVRSLFDPTRRTKRVHVAQGEVVADVAPQPKDRPMAFVTPHAEARVLGTSLRIVVGLGEENRTRLDVSSGRVRLTRSMDRGTVDVPSGHYAVAGANIDLVAMPIRPSPRGRNPKLLDLPDNTWVHVAPRKPKMKAGWSVPWVYDRKNHFFVLYGGISPETNEGWIFDLGGERWTLLSAHDLSAWDRPGAGGSRGLAYDDKRGLVWALGGAAVTPGDRGLWSCNAATGQWTRVRATSEPRLESNDLVCDSANDALITIGRGEGTKRGPWVFDLSQGSWRLGPRGPIGEFGSPYDPGGRNLSFDPRLGQALYFTGPPGDPGETWAFDARTNSWTRLKPAMEPRARTGAGMAYDSLNNVHLLFGGGARPSELYNDTWVYDSSADSWTEMKPAAAPPGGENARFAYDEEHNVALLAHPATGLWAFRYRISK